jgi:Ca2+-binding RTX toxin-like protein
MWITAGGFPDKIFRMSTTGGQIGIFSNANVDGPDGITTGPDGNIWFASGGTGRIGRLSIPRCDGQIATVLRGANGYGAPGAGHDVVVGTSGNDTIDGQGGADRVCGLGGNDTLGGQAGNDRLFGGVGQDKLFGGANSDTCNGSSGVDTASGCEVEIGIP